MIKSMNVKLFRLFSLLISLTLLCCLIACGNSGSTGTPTPSTSSITISSFSGSPTSLAAGQSSILTAKVTNSTGVAVSGQTVSFSFVTNNSGAPALVTLNGGITDANGQAVAIYTAGSTTTSLSLEDTVQATCTGASSSALIITRIATTSNTLTMSASITSLGAGQSSIITATVTNNLGNPVQGQTVTFTKLIDNSTMVLQTLNSGTTDGSGKAIAVYTAGSTNPTTYVQDTIEAQISGGSSYGVVIISRAGTTNSSTVASGYKMTVTSAASSLSAGQTSIITANVTDGSGNPAQGLTVVFSKLIDNSTMVLQTLNSGTTDASGNAIAVYTAGTGASGNVQDTIQASVTSGSYSAAGAVVISVTGTASSGINLTLNAVPTSLNQGQISIVKATVTDASDNPIQGLTVTFTKLIDNSTMGLQTLNSGITDASGNAVAVYTAGSTNPSADVQDTIQASVTSGSYSSTGVAVITRTGSSSTTVASGYKMTLTPSVSSLAAGGQSILTAEVTNGSGNPVSGLTVTFTLVANNSTAILSTVTGTIVTGTTVTATTDAAGRAVAQYTAGTGSLTSTVQDTVSATATDGTYSTAAAAVITRTSGSTVSGYNITLTPTPVSLPAGAMSVLIASVVDQNGNKVSGQTVTFSLVTNNSGASISDVNTTTDATGEAVAVYIAGTFNTSVSLEDAVQASLTSGAADAAIISVLPQAGTGNRIISFTQTPSTTAANPVKAPDKYVTMLATVTTDDLSTPVAGVPVNFSIIAGEGSIVGANDDVAFSGDTPLVVNTDNNGQAYVDFQRPGVGQSDTLVRAQIGGTTNGGDAASIVYWEGTFPYLTLVANPTSVAPSGTSTLSATVNDGNGGIIEGVTVTFALTVNNSGAPPVTPINLGRTQGNGVATAVYQAGTTGSTSDSVSATATYNGVHMGDSVNITVTAP
ncbi:MAG TPA: hypothetical protein VMU29_01625 [Smithella sp.]|nr:hypothetical protein [Smithella sp.]